LSFARAAALADQSYPRSGDVPEEENRSMKMPRLRHALVAAVGLVVLAGCTPEQITAFNQITSPYQDVISEEQLANLRQCESGGIYERASANGRFRGAYQFSQSTWDGVARRHFPWLEGSDPTTVEPWWQDSMARALWSESGSRPWPTCGKRV